MKILRNLLIILLISIVLLCGLIGFSAMRPDLFEGLMKKTEQSSELESIGRTGSAQDTEASLPYPLPCRCRRANPQYRRIRYPKTSPSLKMSFQRTGLYRE